MCIHMAFLILIIMSTLTAAQTLPAPQAVTDPKQVTSKPNAEVEQGEQALSLERLYMTRAVGNTAWSPDGKTIAFVAYMVKPKTSSVYEIDVFDTVMRTTKHLTSGTPKDKMNVGPVWSKDGKFIVYTQQQAKGTDSNIFIADLATAKSTLLTPHQGEQLYSANDISPDGKRVLITSNAGNGYDNVGMLDTATKKIDWLTQDKWEISAGNFSPDGKSVTWTANVDGNTDIYLHDLVSGKTTSLPLPKGVNELGGAESAFMRDGSRLLYYHNGPNSPKDA